MMYLHYKWIIEKNGSQMTPDVGIWPEVKMMEDDHEVGSDMEDINYGR